MADIELFEFPDAGALSDGDYLHINQASADYKVTLGDLTSLFGGIDIYGLTSITTVDNPYYLPISTTTGIAGNRKVSAQDFMKYTQEKQHYTTVSSVNPSDTVVIRPSGSSLLKEVTSDNLQGSLLDATALSPLISPDASDLYVVYDVSASEAKRITQSNLSNSIVKKEVISIPLSEDRNSTLSGSHTLGVKPDIIRVVARCIIDDAGYTAGDRVDLTASNPFDFTYFPPPYHINCGYSVYFDSTDIHVVLARNNGISVINKSHNGLDNLAKDKWVLDITLVSFP